MERHGHGHSLFNAFNHLFRRGQSSSRGTSAEEQVDSVPQLSGALHPQFHSPEPIQLDQSREVTSFVSPATSRTTNEDVEMHFVDPPSDMPSFTTYSAYSASDSSQLPSLPRTGAPATSSHDSHAVDSEALEATHPSVIDIDARSDTSMPPLYDASDSEYDGDRSRHHGYDSMSESDADAYDVEMTLLVDDSDASDDEDPALPSESALPPSVPSVADNSHRNHRHVVVVEEVEDEGQQRTDTIPSASNGQPGSSSHFETPPQPHPHHHHHPHPHTRPHVHFHRHQYPHPPRPQQPDAGARLPNFSPMPGLRTQGQVEGQVPLPGLRTLFQPLIVEAIAQASERFRTAQAAGGPTTGQGPAMGPAAPIVQVTFDLPVFRVPTDAQTRQAQAEARSGVDFQGRTDQTFDDQRPSNVSPPRDDDPNTATFNVNPPTPNPIPTANDAMPPLLRQLFEAAFDAETAGPNAAGPQPGAAPPGWAGLMGLLFGLGLGASHDLNREDPVRARKLVKGLEAVNEGLVKRMRKISEGSADGAICAICWDALLEEDAETTSDTNSGEHRWNATPDSGRSTNQETDVTNTAEPESEPEPEEPLPKVIAMPCSHVFHSACLVPWFSRPKQTTCPTCRFNVDPENLTYEPPRRSQSETRQQQQPIPPQPVAPQQEGQGQREFAPGVVPAPQQAAQQQDGPPLHPPPLRRTIFEHTFTIPFPPPAFPLAHMQAENLPPQPQPEMPQQGPNQQDSLPGPPPATDPFSPMAFQHAFHNLRRQFVPPTQHGPPPPPTAATQEGSTSTPVPPQTQAQPPLPGQGLQPPPQDGQRNTNGMPRFPGLFQFELPQIVRMPDGTWFWSAPLGGFPTPATAAAPQPPLRPGAPKRTWVPPPPPGLTLRQRVEQSEREQGLRCDDMSCGVGPSDDDPEPTADFSRVVIHSLGVDDGSGCEHMFHPACLVSAERVAGWAPDNEGERESADGFVEVSCPVCRAVGVVPRNDWENGVEALS